MDPISTLRRAVGTNGLEARLKDLQQALDDRLENTNRRLDKFVEAMSGQSADLKEGLARLWEAANNQSGEENRRLDQIIEVARELLAATNERLDRLQQAADNQSGDANRRLDQLIEAVNNQSQRAADKLAELTRTIGDRSAGGIANDRLTAQGPSQTNSSLEELRPLLDAVCNAAKSERQGAFALDRILQDVVRPQHRAMFWGDRMLTLDKSAEFRDDPAFKAALSSADSSTGQNQYASPDGISWRYNTLIWATRSCLSVPGDFVECGVYCGDMTWVTTELVDLPGAQKKFYLYDTFEGFDPRYSSEADFPDVPQFFKVIDQDYKAPGLEERVRLRFAAKPYVIITKGSVPDILHSVAPGQIAFLHLDMNSPRAEQGALEFLYDRISPGGILIFDDYGWIIHREQKKAADRLMTARGQVIMELPTGQGLMIKRP